MKMGLLLLLLLTLLGTSHGLRSQVPEQRKDKGAALQECMKLAGIRTVTSGHPDYDKARRTLSHFSSNFPVAVVYPSSTQQVQAAVRCAQAAHIKVLPRCGNHGNEGESVAMGAVTIDLQLMNAVTIAPDMNSAWVQGGAQIGKLLAEAMRVSNQTRGFPSGVRPSVGVSGFVLGGGFGGYTRFAGLGADQLIALKGVDANGDVVVADADNNQALLWASRGGGGGKFVIVTDLQLRLMDVSSGVTNFQYTVPYDQAVDAMMFYQKWAPNLPSRITHRAGVEADKDGRKTYYIGGRYMGSEEDAKKALIASGLHNSKVLHVDKFEFKTTGYLQAVEDGIGFKMPPGPDKFTIMSQRKFWEFEYAWFYKYRSLILDMPLPAEALRVGLEFAQFPGAELEFQALTGQMSAVPQNATAASHLRNGKFVFIIRGAKEPQDNKVTSSAGEIMPRNAQECMLSHSEVQQGYANASIFIQKIGAFVPQVKAYINFRDTDLPSWTDHLTAYYGDDLPALECVKHKYDPTNMFNLPLDVRPPAGDTSHCPELLAKVGTAAGAYSRLLLSSGPAGATPRNTASSAAARPVTTEAGRASAQDSTQQPRKQPVVAGGRKLASGQLLMNSM